MKTVIPDNPSVGAVIGTYASVPYVHLQLECLKRFNSGVVALIHDDCSHRESDLRALCVEYGADFAKPATRRYPAVGDLSAFTEGLRWGREKRLDIVLKVSRRYVIAKPWHESLRELMVSLQYATASAPCAWYGFGFRSESVGMHVLSWLNSGAYAEMASYVSRSEPPHQLPEEYFHGLSRTVHEYAHRPAANALDPEYALGGDFDPVVRSEAYHKRPDSYDGYAWWPLMGLCRHQKIPGILWHDSHVPSDYAAGAQELGLPYTESDFEDPDV